MEVRAASAAVADAAVMTTVTRTLAASKVTVTALGSTPAVVANLLRMELTKLEFVAKSETEPAAMNCD